MPDEQKYQPGDVVQLNERCGNPWFIGCFMQVTEPKSFGAMGFIQLHCEPPASGPCCVLDGVRGQAFYRATFEEMDLIGRAALVPASEEA